MADYTGGYTSAVDSQSHRAYEGANTQWLLDALTAAKHKRDLEEQQRQQLIRDQIVQGQAYSQMAPPPQSPPPGVASQPMQGPQGPPMMPPGGPPMGPGGPPPGPPNIAAHFPPGTTTGTAPNPQAALAIMKAMEASGQKGAIGVQPPAPAGWQPSPGASPALGGPGAPPASAPSTGQIAPPPMGGAGPEASQPGVIPGQMLSVPKAIETLKGMNIPPDQIVRVIDLMLPAMNAQNKQEADAFKLETNAQKAAIEAYKAYILGTQRAETQAKDVASKAERRASGAEQKQEEIDLKRRQQGGGRRSAGGQPPEGFSNDPIAQSEREVQDNVRRTQAWGYINSRVLPYRKGTGGGRDRNDEVMQTVGEIERDLNMTPEEVASMPGVWKADAASLLQSTKKRDAIAGQLESFHNNLRTWDQLAKGLPPTFGGQATKDFAKQLEKINFTGVRSLDDVKLKIQQQVNDPTVSAYMVSAMAAAMDYARIMQGPQSAASLTEGARKDAERLVAAAADDKARAGIIAAMDSDTQGQVRGLDTQIEKIRDRMVSKRGERTGGGAAGAGKGDTSSKVVHWDDLK